MIERAADGQPSQRDDFARRYLPVVRDFLRARWRDSRWETEVDDAVQEVFIQCFKPGGALGRVRRDGRAFHSFLFGVATNVALQFERRNARRAARETIRDEVPDHVMDQDDHGLSRVFDRSFARAIVREAADRMRAAAGDHERLRRVELLDRRFGSNQPIREIAAEWNVPAEKLHREYAKAAREFRAAMRETLGFTGRGDQAAVDAECDRLLQLLG